MYYDLSDADWDPFFRNNNDIKLTDGKIFKVGEQIGT
jgi:hypothetical protein